MNRVATQITIIQERMANLDQAAIDKLDTAMSVDFSEHAAYQNVQASAFAAGLISFDEAQVAYLALGEVGSVDNGGWAAGTDTATKCAVTKLVGVLLPRLAIIG